MHILFFFGLIFLIIFGSIVVWQRLVCLFEIEKEWLENAWQRHYRVMQKANKYSQQRDESEDDALV